MALKRRKGKEPPAEGHQEPSGARQSGSPASEKVVAQDYELVPVAKLTPHPRNPRHGDVGAIFQSIDANGFYGAVIAQKSTGHVLAGNHRLKAAEEAGITAVPVLWLDVDDERALRILLADNRTNDLAGYDTEALAEILSEVQARDGSLDGTGYDGEALDVLLKELGDAVIAEEGKAGKGAGGGGNGGGPMGDPAIQYNIVFNSAQEQQVWFKFLKRLKVEQPDLTVAERIVQFIEAHALAA